VRIRELEQSEISSIELFGIDDFASPSGLPGPQYPQEEFSEEEWDCSEKRYAEFDEAYRQGNLEEIMHRWAAERSGTTIVAQVQSEV
jgi:hypothetical protein